MSDVLSPADLAELTADANFTDMLQKVSFQPGIMLGANALTTEQAYHVRRLNRHQRWLVGPGTVFGMRVDVMTPSANPNSLMLTVSPGYGIDGLGREVLITQPYGLSLSDWLAPANSPPIAAGYIGTLLYLRVTVRAQPCPNQLQPVVAELFDAGIDPVVPAQVGDSFLLEISVDPNQTGDTPAEPLSTWSPDHLIPTSTQLSAIVNTPGTVTAREQTMLQGLSTANPTLASALTMQAWLLGRTPPAFDSSPGSQDNYEESSRLLLASVHVTLPTIQPAGWTPPTLAGTAVNNLVRPFIRPNVLLAALALP